MEITGGLGHSVTFGAGYADRRSKKILCMTSSVSPPPTKLSKPIKMGLKKEWGGKWNKHQ